MSQQDIFDFAGRHILAATYDDVVHASFEEEIASLVEITAVASIEPAFRVEQAALASVFARNLFTAHKDQTALAGGDGLFGVDVTDTDFDRRQRLPNRYEPSANCFVRARHRVAMIIRTEQRNRRTRFR